MRTYSFPTAQTVIDQALSETLGSSSSSLTALQTTALLRKLDVINRDFVNTGAKRHQNGGWSWMRDVPHYFQTKSATTTNGALTTASVSIVFTADVGFDAANGRVWIKTAKGAVDFIDYTAFSTLTATGVTGIGIAHASGEQVEKCYSLPTNFARARRLLIDQTPFDYRKQDQLPYYPTFYTLGGFVVLPEGVGQADATLFYDKSPTDLSTGTSATDLAASLDIPEDFMWYAVHRLSSYIYGTRRKREDKLTALQEAEIELESALQTDASPTTLQGLYTE